MEGNSFAKNLPVCKVIEDLRTFIPPDMLDYDDVNMTTLMYRFGIFYIKRNSHNVVNASEAATWIMKSADQNDRNALFAAGVLSFLGHGLPKNPSTALQYFQRAEKLNKRIFDEYHCTIITALGYCYETGIGTKVNKARAIELYRESVIFYNSANHARDIASYNLGYISYCKGTPYHLKKARQHFEHAAKGNVGMASYALGFMTFFGQAGPCNSRDRG